MKSSSAPVARKPVSAAIARNAALINQLATPGLGSLMAGRWGAGLGQLLLAVAGFALLLAWFAQVLLAYYRLAADAFYEPHISSKFWQAGALIFAAGWLWALATSWSLLNEAKVNARRRLLEPDNQPPVIRDPQPPKNRGV